MASNNSNSNNNNNNQNRLVVPQAQQALDQFKYEIASELGIPIRGATGGQGNYQQALDGYKWEVAQEIGIADQVRQRGWGEMSSRDCGRVGGRIGGKIGGQMVRRLVQLGEQSLAGQQPPQA